MFNIQSKTAEKNQWEKQDKNKRKSEKRAAESEKKEKGKRTMKYILKGKRGKWKRERK